MKHPKRLLLAIGIILFLTILYFSFQEFLPDFKLLLDRTASEDTFTEVIRRHGVRSAIMLVLLAATMCSIPGISNAVVCIFMGLCYGPLIGFLLNVTSNVLGNTTLIVILSKIGLSDKFQKRFSMVNRIKEMHHPFIGLTLGYIVPLFPAIIVNFIATQSQLTKGEIFLSMVLGVAPTSFVYAFGGDAIFRGDHVRGITIIVIALLVFSLITYSVKRKGKAVE